MPVTRAIACVLALAACGSASRPPALEVQLATNAEKYGVVGQAVLVLRDDEVVFRGSHGVVDVDSKRPVQPDQVFPVFSVAKLFTSTLVYELIERGAVELKAPIGRYVVDLPERWRTVTVEQLLDHSSGLPDYFTPGMTSGFPKHAREMFASLADKPLVFEPGSDQRYTQTNYVLLGTLLEAHYGKPYRDIAIERIVRPLALNNTYLGRSAVPADKLPTSYRGTNDKLGLDPVIAWSEYGITHAELYTTVDDLGAFIIAVRNGRFVKQATLLALWKPHRLPDGSTGWFASGWEYEPNGAEHFVGHDGGAVLRVRLVFTDSLARGTSTYIYLTNGSRTNVWSRTLIDSLRR